MEGREILGETAAGLLDSLEDELNENEQITDAFVIAHVHVDDETEEGRSYLRVRSSNPSWVFQLGIAHAIVDMLSSNDRGITREVDEEDDDAEEI